MCTCKRYFQKIVAMQNNSIHLYRYLDASGFLCFGISRFLSTCSLSLLYHCYICQPNIFDVLNRANSDQHAATHRQHPPARSLSSYRDPLPQHSHLIRDSCQPTVNHPTKAMVHCFHYQLERKKSINESLRYLHLFVRFVSKYSVSFAF